MSDGTPFLRVAADRSGAPGSARIVGKNAIPGHQRRKLVLNHPDRREDGCHSKANCTSSGFESHSTGWEVSIWGIPIKLDRAAPAGTEHHFFRIYRGLARPVASQKRAVYGQRGIVRASGDKRYHGGPYAARRVLQSAVETQGEGERKAKATRLQICLGKGVRCRDRRPPDAERVFSSVRIVAFRRCVLRVVGLGGPRHAVIPSATFP